MLQRAVGNRGMAELARTGRLQSETVLARQPDPPTTEPPATSGSGSGTGTSAPVVSAQIQAFDTAVAADDWEAAAVALNSASSTDITAKVATLSVLQCRKLLAALRLSSSLTATNNIERPLKDHSGIIDGEIFGTVGYQTTPHDAASAGGQYSFDIWIQFHPDADVVDCPEIAVVQTVRLVNTGTDTNAETLPHLIRRQNANASSIDRIEGRRYGFYGYENNDTASGDPGTRSRPVAGGNMRAGSAPTPLRSMHYYDGPGDTMTGVTFQFETAVVAKSGPQRGIVYSVIKWGFDVRADGTLRRHRVRLRDRISADFRSARRAWNAQARGPAAQRNDPNQRTLPSLR